jgi:hypothetical protein
MSDQPITPTPAPKTPSSRADQDQEVANFITQTRQMIEIARDDHVIAPILAARGYNAAALAQGLALQQTAQSTFTARQTAMAAQQQAAAAAADALAAARATYTDFRETARSTFSNPDARTALKVTGKIPEDLQKFLTTARSSYAVAQSAPYQATLATYGFPAATLASAVAALDALSEAYKAQETIGQDAVKATADRDAAVKALKQWAKQFKGIASVALRAQPTQAKKLGL